MGCLCFFHVPVTHSSDTPPPTRPRLLILSVLQEGTNHFRYMSHSHSNHYRREYTPFGTEEKQMSRNPIHDRNAHLQIRKPNWEQRQTLYSCVPRVFSGVKPGLNGHFLNRFELWGPWRKSCVRHSGATNLYDPRKGTFLHCSQLEFTVTVLSNWIDIHAQKEVGLFSKIH